MGDDRKELLLRMMAAEFAAIDLNLYLDTHPRDECALAEYAKVSEAVMHLHHEYEERYGPILNYGHIHSLGPDGNRVFRWLSEPWPWETTF